MERQNGGRLKCINVRQIRFIILSVLYGYETIAKTPFNMCDKNIKNIGNLNYEIIIAWYTDKMAVVID